MWMMMTKKVVRHVDCAVVHVAFVASVVIEHLRSILMTIVKWHGTFLLVREYILKLWLLYCFSKSFWHICFNLFFSFLFLFWKKYLFWWSNFFLFFFCLKHIFIKAALIFYSVLMIPYVIGFNVDPPAPMVTFNWIVDGTFALDMVCVFMNE